MVLGIHYSIIIIRNPQNGIGNYFGSYITLKRQNHPALADAGPKDIPEGTSIGALILEECLGFRV